MATTVRGNDGAIPCSKFLSRRTRMALAIAGAFAGCGLIHSSTAHAANTFFNNGGGDNTWENAANWTNGIPTTGNSAFLDGGFTINSTGASNVSNELQVGAAANAYGNAGNPGGSAILNINAGSISPAGNFVLAQSGSAADTSGTVNIASGASLLVHGNNSLFGFFGVDANTPSVATLNVNGGTADFNAGNNNGTMWIGGDSLTNHFGVGIINLNSGTLNTAAARVGDFGTGTFNMLGGTFNSNFYMSVGLGNNPNAGGGTLNVSGGVMNLAQLSVNENKVNDCVATQSGGTINVGDVTGIDGYNFRVGLSNVGKGIYNMTGGTLNVAGNDLLVGAGQNGVMNISGNSAVNVNYMAVPNRSSDYGFALGNSNNGTAIVNQTSGTVTIANTSLLGIFFKGTNGGTSTYNLNGGSLTTGNISADSGTTVKTFNFNGGTLIASKNMTVPNPGRTASPANFLTTLSAGGANIDTNGNSVAWATPISGAGTLNKIGTGTLTLSAINTYTGNTKVAAGTLTFNRTVSSNNIGGADVVGYYRFASPATLLQDSSGHGNDLVDANPGSPLQYSSNAPAGKAGSLNMFGNFNAATQDYLTTPDGNVPAGFPIGNASYTLAAWVNVSGANNDNNGIIGWGDYGTNSAVNALKTTGNGTAINNYWWANDLQIGGLPTVNGNWHYIAATYDATLNVRNLYLDGNVIGSNNPGAPNTNAGENFAVGRAAFAEFFDGYITDVLVSTSALSQASIVNASNGVMAGTVTSQGSLGSGSLAISSGATVDMNGTTQTAAGLLDNGGGGGTVTNSNATNVAVLTLNPSTAVAFSGAIVDGASKIALTMAGTGTQTLSGANTYTGNTTVSSGTLAIAGVNGLSGGSNVSIASSAKLVAVSHGANPKTILKIGSLSIAGTGNLDLNNNDMIVHTSTLSAVTNQLKSGFNAGSGYWNGLGIISTSAANDASKITTLGVGTGLTTFDGQSVLSTDVVVKYTYYGDADLNGFVNGNDYSLIDFAFTHQGTLSGWQNGDFNYDGKIDGSDYTLMDNAFNRQGASLAAAPANMLASASSIVSPSPVPEPTSSALIVLGAAGLVSRRRRK